MKKQDVIMIISESDSIAQTDVKRDIKTCYKIQNIGLENVVSYNVNFIK